MSFVVWLVAASGWDTGTGTYAGDGFDETGFSRALVADDYDARELEVYVRAADHVAWLVGGLCHTKRKKCSPKGTKEANKVDELSGALRVVGDIEGLVLFMCCSVESQLGACHD